VFVGFGVGGDVVWLEDYLHGKLGFSEDARGCVPRRARGRGCSSRRSWDGEGVKKGNKRGRTNIPTLPPRRKTLPGRASSLSFFTSALSFTKPSLPPPKRSTLCTSIFRREYGDAWKGWDLLECWRDRECCKVEVQFLKAVKDRSSSWVGPSDVEGRWTGQGGVEDGRVNVVIVALDEVVEVETARQR